jgi:hypothetical protein
MNLSPERALILLLYGIYLTGCVHWVGPGKVALIRIRGEGWIRKQATHASYTLLGRMPVMRNPFSTSCGFALVPETAASAEVNGRLRGLEHRTKILSIVAAISGVALLVVLPAIIYFGLLPLLWKPLVWMLLVLHTMVLIEFVACTGMWRRRDPGTFWPALVALGLSPLGAVQAADVVAGWKVGLAVRRG